jgi:hypothetical protein
LLLLVAPGVLAVQEAQLVLQVALVLVQLRQLQQPMLNRLQLMLELVVLLGLLFKDIH